MIADANIDRARSTPIESVIEQRGIKLRGRNDRVGACPKCGGTDRFDINIRKQLFNCRGCAVGGDVIALIQFLDECDFSDACRTLAGELPRITIKLQQRCDEKDTKQQDKAQWLWWSSCPPLQTPVENYLRVRGIKSPFPATTIRYLPPLKAGHHPAMIVPYGLPDEPEPGELAITESAINAVQLTLLKPNGSGKANVEKPKINIASPVGLPMVIAPMNDLMGLAITEGVEDALSVHSATGLGAWASGGASFMPKLITAIDDLAAREYDGSPESVTIFAHADEAGQRHAYELADALAQRGIKIFLEGL
jgi:putative DNA primase/helicase